ncbi:MAG: exodeoxyribonuclease VII large subunit [Clostridia bacterium]|nr:exodeoxyribonuclease VII large subunit [Clostridia bacterium]
MMEKAAITVTQLNQYLKNVLEADFNLRGICVMGEISNLTIHGSGHIYFRLKDEGGIISAVMFRSNASKLRFRPENGMKVIAKGSISIFEKTGVYQLYITDLREDGVGDLHLAFEQLKKQLAAAGIFNEQHKLKIPPIPSRIGVITAPTGAAVQDIIQILGRRFPAAEVDVFPAIVQGDQAPASLIRGIEYFEKTKSVDVIIIGRGGGSIEDLWGFNDPDLALSIYNCTIPTISAVGHETDFTICDFVADLRAPTPSGAAELAVPNAEDLRVNISQSKKRIAAALTRVVQNNKNLLTRYTQAKVLNDPKAFTDKPYLLLDHWTEKLLGSIQKHYKLQEQKLLTNISKLDALSPLKVLGRGYSFVEHEEKGVIQKIEKLSVDDVIQIHMSDGKARCIVDNITLKNCNE